MSEEEPPRTTAGKQRELNKRGKTKIRVADGRVETYESSPSPEKPRRVTPFQIGQLVDGQGIFIGTWSPRDNEGNSLRKTFNIFAAPQDLPGTNRYIEVVEHIAGLENWHGHDGADCQTEGELREALKDDSYNGGWVVPPRELLTGKDSKGNKVQADNLYAHKDKGALRGTFSDVVMYRSDYSDWYWSSTGYAVLPRYMHDARFSDGAESWSHIGTCGLRCRPVRLVPA